MDELILTHLLRSKSMKSLSLVASLLNDLAKVYPPHMIFPKVTQKEGPHDMKNFWNIFNSEIIPMTNGKWASRWTLKYLVSMLEQDLLHCMTLNRLNKSIISRCVASSSSLELIIQIPIKMIINAFQVFESDPESKQDLANGMASTVRKVIDLEFLKDLVRILDMVFY